MMITNGKLDHDISFWVDDFSKRQWRYVTPHFEGTGDSTSDRSYAQIGGIVFYSANTNQYNW